MTTFTGPKRSIHSRKKQARAAKHNGGRYLTFRNQEEKPPPSKKESTCNLSFAQEKRSPFGCSGGAKKKRKKDAPPKEKKKKAARSYRTGGKKKEY